MYQPFSEWITLVVVVVVVMVGVVVVMVVVAAAAAAAAAIAMVSWLSRTNLGSRFWFIHVASHQVLSTSDQQPWFAFFNRDEVSRVTLLDGLNDQHFGVAVVLAA